MSKAILDPSRPGLGAWVMEGCRRDGNRRLVQRRTAFKCRRYRYVVLIKYLVHQAAFSDYSCGGGGVGGGVDIGVGDYF